MSTSVSSEAIECSYGPSSQADTGSSCWERKGCWVFGVFINETTNQLLCKLHLEMLNYFFNTDELPPWLGWVSDMYLYCGISSCYGIGIGARLNAGRRKWKELWEGEMRSENSKDQRNWSSALDDWGSLEGHFSSPTLSWYATANLEFSFQKVVEILSSPSSIGSCELFLVIKGFFHPNTWDSKYSLCIYSSVLRLKGYNPHGHWKFHKTD